MTQKKQLTISEFSRLTGIKRENLRFYHRIGLLQPEKRGENNYRYYSRHQLNTAYLISSLRGLGVGIEAIKQYSKERTPEKALELFAQQDQRIKAEIQQLNETRLIMKIHSDMTQEALVRPENALFIETKKQEPIFLCPPIPKHMDNDEGGIFSYEYAEAHGINWGYPQGTLIEQAYAENCNATATGRYYFKTAKGSNGYKPAGLYAVAYGRGDPWQSNPLYKRLLDFIHEQGLIICGDAYEEYPINDISVQEIEQYGIRVEVPVIKKA